MDEETRRQLFHIAIGIGAIILLELLGKGFMIAALFFIIIIGMLLINARLLGKKIAFVQWFEVHFERPDVLFPGWGSACYATGVLIPMAYLENIPAILAIVYVLAIGDGIATMVGKAGKIRLPYNKNKTTEGTLAFFLASLPAYYFIGWMAIPLALIATLVESINFPIDDNLTIPIAATLFFLVML